MVFLRLGRRIEGLRFSGIGINGYTVLSERYGYGYQGSEKDNEIKGNGNSYTTHFRQLDPRVGRWLTIDPKASSLPWQSVYCSMHNNPIWHNDVLGDDIFSKNRLGRKLEHRDGKVFKKNGEEFTGKLRGVHAQTQENLAKLKEKPVGSSLVCEFEGNPNRDVTIKNGKISKTTPFNKELATNKVGCSSRIKIAKSNDAPSFISLGHELAHASDYAKGKALIYKVTEFSDGSAMRREEFDATHVENQIRAEHGMVLRTHYEHGNEKTRTVNTDGSARFKQSYFYYGKINSEVETILNSIPQIDHI